MFDLVANRKRLVQIVIAVIMLPFALFGVDFYFRGMDSSDQIAKVGDRSIGGNEFGRALRDHQDQMRRVTQGKVDLEMLNSPAVRAGVLDQLIDQKLLIKGAEKDKIMVSDLQLSEYIHDVPAFRDEAGKFSKERYEMLLRTQGMTPAVFEANLRRDALVGQLRQAVESTHWLPKTVTQRLSGIRAQKREVSQHVLTLQSYEAGITIEPSEAKDYYDKNPKLYNLPERVRVEYLQLSMEGLVKSIKVGDDEVQKYYQEHSAQFEKPEERHASHILIAADEKATPEVKAKAKARAEELLAQAKKNPAGFGELAKAHSQDPGSSPSGGDLGFFQRGRMAKDFDDTVFGMKAAGEIAGPVATRFGYHIIKLEAIKPVERQPVEAVRAQIEDDIRKSTGSRQFAEKAEQFSSLVYEQSDSLKPAADALKLIPEQSAWITRDRAEPAALNNAKLLGAIFSGESIKSKRNTEAIDIGGNTLVAARVIEHVPSARQPLEIVRELIVDHLRSTKAAALAKKDGEATLARLKKGETPAMTWSTPVMVSREKPEGLSPEAAQAVFRTDVTKLPAYVGYTTPDQRYVIFRVGRVEAGTTLDATQSKEVSDQISTIIARELQAARMKALRDRSKVTINQSKLEKS